MDPSRVSIVIPVLDEEERVVPAVDRARDTGAGEVIVVDGGSRDGTLPAARRTDCLLLEALRGRARQMNLGARHATGEVLLFLHADTWLAAHGVRQICDALRDDRVVWGAFRQQIEAPGRLYRWLERGNALRAGRRGLPYGDQGIFVRRAVFEELGGFPELELMEDLYFARRLKRVARPLLLSGPLHVSPRRWQRHGVIRQTLRNRILLLAVRLGVSPNRLARYYYGPAAETRSEETSPQSSGMGEVAE